MNQAEIPDLYSGNRAVTVTLADVVSTRCPSARHRKFISDEPIIASALIHQPPFPGEAADPRSFLIVATGRRLLALERKKSTWWIEDVRAFAQPVTGLGVSRTTRLIARKIRSAPDREVFWQESEVASIQIELGRQKPSLYFSRGRFHSAREFDVLWQKLPTAPTFEWQQSSFQCQLPDHPHSEIRALSGHLFLWNTKLGRASYLGPRRDGQSVIHVRCAFNVRHPCSVHWEDWGIVISRLSSKVLGRFRFMNRLTHFEALTFEPSGPRTPIAFGTLAVAGETRFSLLHLSQAFPEGSSIDFPDRIVKSAAGRYFDIRDDKPTGITHRHFDLKIDNAATVTCAVDESRAVGTLRQLAPSNRRVAAFEISESSLEGSFEPHSALEVRSTGGSLFLYCRKNGYAVYLGPLENADKAKTRVLKSSGGGCWCAAVFWGSSLVVVDLNTLQGKLSLRLSRRIDHLELANSYDPARARPNTQLALVGIDDELLLYDIGGTTPRLTCRRELQEAPQSVAILPLERFGSLGEYVMAKVKFRGSANRMFAIKPGMISELDHYL
jgi:hypothetical protein